MTGAVGMIAETAHANEIITGGDADMVFLARELMRQPYWALDASTSWEWIRAGRCSTATRFGGGPGELVSASVHPRSGRNSSTRACSKDSPSPSANERRGISDGRPSRS